MRDALQLLCVWTGSCRHSVRQLVLKVAVQLRPVSHLPIQLVCSVLQDFEQALLKAPKTGSYAASTGLMVWPQRCRSAAVVPASLPIS